MAKVIDGAASALFTPLAFGGKLAIKALAKAGVSEQMAKALKHAPAGGCVSWGIPFRIAKAVLIREKDKPVTVPLKPTKAPYLIFLHTSDARPMETNAGGFTTSHGGPGRLGEHAADYVILYADGTEKRFPIRRRFQIGAFSRGWSENCFEAVAHHKPHSLKSHPDDVNPNSYWGRIQTRHTTADSGPWVNWLWAIENPRPDKAVVGVRFEPLCGAVIVFGITAGRTESLPTRWRTRRKAVLRLPAGVKLDPAVGDDGNFKQIQLDMGCIISVASRLIYPDRTWARTYNNRSPEISERDVVIEYASHEEARFHLAGGRTVPVAKVEKPAGCGPLTPVPPATQRVTFSILDKQSRLPVPVKLHVHGRAGEYLAPDDRHRIPNSCWFEDYSVDFSHWGIHHCTYISGATQIELPLGSVYVEVSRGFEIRPIRKVVRVGKATREIVIEIEKVLPWRERGWVTADTHVHFLSPQSALLEGAAEGVNVVNLLASQWGELMTNVGDFDGKTTFGAKEFGGDGEHLVRVGTENRQHVLGHISLLGYNGRIISPMTSGGPDESAIGDPIAVLLTEWASQCQKQGGVVVMPHFPNPRAENAAAILSGDVNGVEMTSWGSLYAGINPYSLSDWYRYLNCGHFVAAVAGTDKMSASTAVGTVRTYARIDTDRQFTYEAWKDAIRKGQTFVTYGPLMEFAVEGCGPGARLELPPGGGTLDVTWQLASVTVPMSRVELVVNGEIRCGQTINPGEARGHWSVKVDRSSWLALLVRGHYSDKPEIIAAHSSPVMAAVKGSEFFAAADAMTILQQIEGSLAYLDTVGTRTQTQAYRRMRMILTAAHRSLHNRMHQAGHYHEHTIATGHKEHHN
ncbi:MAG: CehA/McbA family metallohydrolase [Planctomycetes bacterium]|nr:CehA/McbA family metallohydrolase [Planctomycetota bacterium]